MSCERPSGTVSLPSKIPVGGESGLRGIADLLTDAAIIYENGSSTTVAIPDDLAATEHEVREQLVEGIVVGDDDLMERYLEGDVPSTAELEESSPPVSPTAWSFPSSAGRR